MATCETCVKNGVNQNPVFSVADEDLQAGKLIVATYNVAGGCQHLLPWPYCSERSTVKRMRSEGAPRGGKHAAEFMADQRVDLLGVQEMLPFNGTRFQRFMGEEYGCHQPLPGLWASNSSSAILYRKEKLGAVEHLRDLRAERSGVRSASAVYIPRFRLIFLSVHLDHQHGVDVKKNMLESLDTSLRVAKGTRPVDRVIAVMDSNDCRAELTSFTLLAKELRMVGQPCRTCAEDRCFWAVGDYIFDSSPNGPEPFGVPKLPNQWGPHTQLMSDHLPILAVVKTETFEDESSASHALPAKRVGTGAYCTLMILLAALAYGAYGARRPSIFNIV